jgi:hypothetical protein
MLGRDDVGSVEHCGRKLTLVLSGSCYATKQMNAVNGNDDSSFLIYVQACHDWGIRRAKKVPRAAATSAKVRRIRLGWSYIGWPIGGNAKRPDSIDFIAGPKFEAR